MQKPVAVAPARQPEALPAPTASVPFRAALLFWFRLGLISFGGPAGQIAIMHAELVERRRWIGERRFLHALNYCMVLPGPEAQQLATYIGWLMHGARGGILAGTLFVLPSLLLLILLSWIYAAFGAMPLIAGLFAGVKPAVAAIVVQAVHRVGSRALRARWLWGVAVLAWIGVTALELPFPLILVCAALTGLLKARLTRPQTAPSAGTDAAPPSVAAGMPAILDEDSPRAPHTRFSPGGLARVLAICMLLWIVPIAWLTWRFGWQHTLTQMGWFFTKAALLTFGGAYAVLPYVFQGAVEHYGWISAAQMMDGLALGETTPGPLIIVVSFVGFIGGWTKAVFGPDALFAAGASAATLVAWFTFLPSFLFILAGGPLIESTRRHTRLIEPLQAITAAVVGSMLNLACLFGRQLLWPQGWGSGIDWTSAALIAGAAIALFRFGRSILEVIVVCALIGLAIATLANPAGMISAFHFHT